MLVKVTCEVLKGFQKLGKSLCDLAFKHTRSAEAGPAQFVRAPQILKDIANWTTPNGSVPESSHDCRPCYALPGDVMPKGEPRVRIGEVEPYTSSATPKGLRSYSCCDIPIPPADASEVPLYRPILK
jgi:hypothetical protein